MCVSRNITNLIRLLSHVKCPCFVRPIKKDKGSAEDNYLLENGGH